MKEFVERLQSLNSLYFKVMGEIFMGLKPNENFNTLTGVQMHTLCLLERNGPQRMKDIADNGAVSMPSATGIIDRMVRADLVHRFEDPRDRRVTLVELSPRGRTAMEQINRMHEQRLQELLSRLAPDRQVALVKAFEQIYELLQETQQHADSEKETGARKSGVHG